MTALPLQPLPLRSSTLPLVPPRPLVVAHRGASALAPENTLPAVRAALLARADLVECDVRLTRDDELVVIHDRDAARTTDAAIRLPGREGWEIADLTLAQVRRLDAGSWFAPEYAGVGIPTLEEWLWAVTPAARALIEVKHPHRHRGIGARLAELVADRPDLIVQSFAHDWLRGFRERCPDVEVGALVKAKPSRDEVLDLASWAHWINPRFRSVGGGTIRRIREAGARSLVWTVNNPLAMRRAVAAGVDGLITDHPDTARIVVDRRLGGRRLSRPA